MQSYHRLISFQQRNTLPQFRSHRGFVPSSLAAAPTPLSSSGQSLVYIASAARRFYGDGITDTMPVIEAIHAECDRNGDKATRDLLDSADGLIQSVVKSTLDSLDRMEAQEVAA